MPAWWNLLHTYIFRAIFLRARIFYLRARREVERKIEGGKKKKEKKEKKGKQKKRDIRHQAQTTDNNGLVSRPARILWDVIKSLIRLISLGLDRHHRPGNMQRLTSRVFAQAPSSCDRLKCQAWNSGCALEAELIGRRLRPPSFMCFHSQHVGSDRFNRSCPILVLFIDGLGFDAVFPQDWLYAFFIGGLTLPDLPFALQDGWGFTDPATKPAPFHFSRHDTRMQDESPSHVYRRLQRRGKIRVPLF
jgi:hypothetical protein